MNAFHGCNNRGPGIEHRCYMGILEKEMDTTVSGSEFRVALK